MDIIDDAKINKPHPYYPSFEEYSLNLLKSTVVDNKFVPEKPKKLTINEKMNRINNENINDVYYINEKYYNKCNNDNNSLFDIIANHLISNSYNTDYQYIRQLIYDFILSNKQSNEYR